MLAERIFRGFLFLSRRTFSQILSPDVFSSLLWGKVPRKILQENPRQNPSNFVRQRSPTIFCRGARPKHYHKYWGKLFYLQLELFCLQLSFFAYSPLRPLLDALSHCKQKSTPTVSRKAKTASKKAPTVSKKAKLSTVSKKAPL